MSNYLHIQANGTAAGPVTPGTSAGAAPSARIHAGPSRRLAWTAAAFAAVWLAGATALGAAGFFHAPPESPPVAILAAIAAPPLLFLILLRAAPGLRREVLAIDPVWLTAVQGWRVVGVGFLFLYAFGHLPGLFAYPAGLGDLLVAALAPFLASRLAREPAFLASPWLWRFHVLGVADFAVAVGTALLARGTFPGLVGGVTSNGLGELPLVLIPAFAVPIWICLHLCAFTQMREARRGREADLA